MDFVANKLLVCFFLKYSVFFSIFLFIIYASDTECEKKYQWKKITENERHNRHRREKEKDVCDATVVARQISILVYKSEECKYCVFIHVYVGLRYVCMR